MRVLTKLASILLISFQSFSACAVNVSVDFDNAIGTNKLLYGLNEVDRKYYFAGYPSTYPSNSTIVQNHRDMGTKIIRIFFRRDDTQGFRDAYIKAVIDTGAVPMVCFQDMPNRNDSTDFDNYARWCRDQMARYKGMYDINNWYWEVVNEPNNTGTTVGEWVGFYNYLEPMLHAVDPKAKVGGPALAGFDSYWIKRLFEVIQGRSNAVQFISWHRYGTWADPVNAPSDDAVLAQTPCYSDDVDIAQYMIDSYRPGKGIEKVVSELNMNSWAGTTGGMWNTDPRIKTVFNTSFYSSALRYLIFTPLGSQADVEMMWEGTGDDYEGGSRGFGIWYAQQPANRSPVFHAKRLIASCIPKGASLFMVDEGGSSALDALGCRVVDGSGQSHYRLLLVNKTTASTPVTISISGISVTSASWITSDSLNPEGRTDTAPASNSQSTTMNGYSIKLLLLDGNTDPKRIHMTANPTVSQITSTTAVITWQTDLISDARVEYGTTKSYGQSAYSGVLGASHAVTLTGLVPGTPYHFRVRSANDSAGYIETSSRDCVFLTTGDLGKVVNGSFESGFPHAWTRYGIFHDGGNLGISRDSWYDVTAQDGRFFAGCAASGEAKNGGFYQRVTVNQGRYYRLTGYVSCAGTGTICRIGVDTSGGVDPASTAVQWVTRTNTSKSWIQLSQYFLASGPYATVFLDSQQTITTSFNQNAFDNIVLAEGAQIRSIKSLPNKTEVMLLGVTCTAGSDQIPGMFYVEDDDRSSGIKVQTGVAAAVKEGDRVHVLGKIDTANGERFIFSSTGPAVISSGNIVSNPLGMINMNLGGAALNGSTPGVAGGVGLNNVGLLVKVFGRVRSSGSGYFYIDDGSGLKDGSETGIRINTGSLTNKPALGKMVAVIGISTVTYRSGGYVRTVRARKSADIKVLD